MVNDLMFRVDVDWLGATGERRGTLDTGAQSVAWSVPASMGGLGEGTSPEELLMAAVGTCYSATLAGVLRQRRLPVGAVKLMVEGTVAGYPDKGHIARIEVHPRLAAAEAARAPEYQDAANEARNRCFIGHALRADIVYAVGSVQFS